MHVMAVPISACVVIVVVSVLLLFVGKNYVYSLSYATILRPCRTIINDLHLCQCKNNKKKIKNTKKKLLPTKNLNSQM